MTWWSILPPEPGAWAPWTSYTPDHQPEEAFTPEECQRFIELSGRKKKQSGSVGEEGHVDTEVRNVSVRNLGLSPATMPLFDKLVRAMTGANNAWWKLDVTHLMSLEVLKYTPGGHYVPHLDMGPGFQTRKLSAVVMLSDPASYEGGDLVIQARSGELDVAPRAQGSIIVFPAWTWHGVQPVMSGTRHTATAWIQGPALR